MTEETKRPVETKGPTAKKKPAPKKKPASKEAVIEKPKDDFGGMYSGVQSQED